MTRFSKPHKKSLTLILTLALLGLGGAAVPVMAQEQDHHDPVQRNTHNDGVQRNTHDAAPQNIHNAAPQNNAYNDDAQRRHDCANRKKKKRNKILGAIGGAAVGGLVGRKIDGGKHREVGTVAGAAGGALAGQAVAGKLTGCERYQNNAGSHAVQPGH